MPMPARATPVSPNATPEATPMSLKLPLPLLLVELVRLRVVGDEEVGPGVGVEVELREPERLGARVLEPGLLRGVLEVAARRAAVEP